MVLSLAGMKFFKSPLGIKLWMEKHKGRYWVHINGRTLFAGQTASTVKKQRPEEKTMRFISQLKAPFPGRITAVKVKEKEWAAAGRHLIVIESMKMEHTLHVHCRSQVQSIKVKEGQSVEFDELLITFNPLEAKL